MPVVVPADAPPDGRQLAGVLARGVMRWLAHHGYQPLPEFILRTGRRVDAIGVSARGDVWVVEIKTSLADLRSDSKWPEYLPFCDRFFFAVPADFALDALPDTPGVLVADGHGAELVRAAPETRVNAARRRALLLRFGLSAASRLHRLSDPAL